MRNQTSPSYYTRAFLLGFSHFFDKESIFILLGIRIILEEELECFQVYQFL